MKPVRVVLQSYDWGIHGETTRYNLCALHTARRVLSNVARPLYTRERGWNFGASSRLPAAILWRKSMIVQ